MSTPVLFEYEAVLKRKNILKKISLSAEQVEDILDLLVLLADKPAWPGCPTKKVK
jgi:hypothetical protein